MSKREKIDIEIVGLDNCSFSMHISNFLYKLLKKLERLEREFCTFLARVVCSNFGYEDFWAFLDFIYKKLEISLSVLF